MKVMDEGTKRIELYNKLNTSSITSDSLSIDPSRKNSQIKEPEKNSNIGKEYEKVISLFKE